MHVDTILRTRNGFSNFGIWPRIPSDTNPQKWLANFTEEEYDHAIALLNAFVYFDDEHTNQLLRSAYHDISSRTDKDASPVFPTRASWAEYREGLIVTFPTGETPNPTDSGHLFARRARQRLGITESQLMMPEDAVASLAFGRRRPLMLIDDFAGSGDQFIKTWERNYPLLDGREYSMAGLANEGRLSSVVYCNAVSTSTAATRIAEVAPQVHLACAHLLAAEASVTHPECYLLPSDVRATIVDTIASASERAGIQENARYGYKELGLAIAFEHSVPDATIPLFWAETPGWTCLVKRR
ncbi:phosphoribosyltransferase-like protein [Demequina activiva]|uniref:PRTase-CE domain-containing protein n=1 Tax=Demequina activiva TaxID=1582364 RepID=A0A919Q3F3_9MICO|nr:hypothetical protein [Demequina activiva]GIG55339.1 hypothetical protein Dac01nite_20910 [Demequina activiva]